MTQNADCGELSQRVLKVIGHRELMTRELAYIMSHSSWWCGCLGDAQYPCKYPSTHVPRSDSSAMFLSSPQ